MNKTWLILFAFLSIFLFGNYYIRAAYSYDQNDSLHVTIVGKKNDAAANSLYDAALKYAPQGSRIQWQDSSEGKPLNSGTEYPTLNKAAAYVCMQFRCSLPAFTPSQLQTIIQHFAAPVQTIASVPNIVSVNNQSNVLKTLETRNWWLIISMFWFVGLLLAITPCVLPLILIFTSLVGGRAETLTKRKAFILSLIYILALASTYAIAGITVASFGFYLQAYMQNKWILGSFSLLFVLLGISLFGFFKLSVPLRWRRNISSYSQAHGGGSYIGVAVMGVLATLIASPCVAAPLAGILAYIAQSGDVELGGIALFSTGIGIGTPLLLIGTLGIGILQKAGSWQKTIKEFFGLLLFVIAIWLLERILPANEIMFLWAALAIFTAIYMGALKQPDTSALSFRKSSGRIVNALTRTLSLMILVYGAALLVGALIGNTNPLSPLGRQPLSQADNTPAPATFKHVKNLTELQQSLTAAQAMHKPVILFFSATWCTSCKEMHNDVLTDDNVQALLRKFVLLSTDLTDMNSEDIKLAKYFGVTGPPAILFFENAGLTYTMRLDGAISAEKLTEALKLILNKNATVEIKK